MFDENMDLECIKICKAINRIHGIETSGNREFIGGIKMKPNCYKCEYKGSVPGDAHSCCKYPGTSTDMFDMFNRNNIILAQKLNISGNAHGVRNGWFWWPVNFDPVWLESCNGFKEKV